LELWSGSSRPGHAYYTPGRPALGQSAALMGSTRGGGAGGRPLADSGPLSEGAVPKPLRARRKRSNSTPSSSARWAQRTANKTRTEGTPRATKAPVPVVLPGPEHLGSKVRRPGALLTGQRMRMDGELGIGAARQGGAAFWNWTGLPVLRLHQLEPDVTIGSGAAEFGPRPVLRDGSDRGTELTREPAPGLDTHLRRFVTGRAVPPVRHSGEVLVLAG
jgi:hypothetical protein